MITDEFVFLVSKSKYKLLIIWFYLNKLYLSTMKIAGVFYITYLDILGNLQ